MLSFDFWLANIWSGAIILTQLYGTEIMKFELDNDDVFNTSSNEILN
jgi:hypothetical protein